MIYPRTIDPMKENADKYIYYRGDEYALYSFLDSHVKEFMGEEPFEEVRIPSLIRTDILSRCGYFESFPQQVVVAAAARRDQYEEIADKGEIENDQIEMSGCCLTPAACLHIYPMFENRSVDNGIITARARVYRNEESGSDDAVRLMEFSVREIVAIGSREYVESVLDRIRRNALEFAKKISEQAYVKDSYDLFYPTKVNIYKTKMQLADSMKKELMIRIGDGEIAVASFNFHGSHFSRIFNFDNGGKVVTGCAGFGLDRLLYACKTAGSNVVYRRGDEG